MYACHTCGFDFREAVGRGVLSPNKEVHRLFDAMLLSLEKSADQAGQFDLGFFAVLHQLCLMVEARPNHGKLQHFVAEQLGTPSLPFPAKRLTVEQHKQEERHQVLLCGLWLMGDMTQRLREAWLEKAVRYNLMLKDFEDAPKWYRLLVRPFSNWRTPNVG